jgi:hypothetical protein
MPGISTGGWGLSVSRSGESYVSVVSHAGQVIAMRNATGLHWMFGDHLGSASTVRTPAGTNVRQRYLPFGRVRGAATLPTEYGFTGQRLDPSGIGIACSAAGGLAGIGCAVGGLIWGNVNGADWGGGLFDWLVSPPAPPGVLP